MKKITAILLIIVAFSSCSKKDAVDASSTAAYQLRVVAIDLDGSRSYTPITRVKAGKVAVEFETAEVANVKEYRVEASADGVSFKNVKTIAADVRTPNRLYRDTVVLE